MSALDFDDPFGDYQVNVHDRIDADWIINRIVAIAASLDAYEAYHRLMGDAEVGILIMPESIEIHIWWNEPDKVDVKILIAKPGSALQKLQSIRHALDRNLRPALED